MKKFLRKYWFQLVALVVIAGIAAFRLVFMFTPMIIETGSMEPTLPINSVVFIQPTDTLKPTDIITFKQDTDVRPTTHTFIGYADDGSLMTKGDANPAPDVRSVPLQMSDVEGKVMFVVPFLVPAYWASMQGMLSLAIVAFVVIAVAFIYLKDKKDSRKETATKREEIPETTPV